MTEIQATDSRFGWATPANIVTLGRVALLPVFAVTVLQAHWALGLVILVTISASDFVDGQLARRLDQVTLFGTRLDPIADRLTVLTVVGSYVATHLLPWWTLVALILTDLVLLVLLGRQKPPPVGWVGKVRTALLLVGLPLLLAGQLWRVAVVEEAAYWAVLVGAAGHVIAGVGYGVRIRAAR